MGTDPGNQFGRRKNSDSNSQYVGVLISINSDAHSAADFGNLRFGIGQARRGWLEKADVLNTRPLVQLRKLLAKTMTGS